MPRRSLAEECRTSRTRARLSAEAECLLDRLITVADDFGIFEADPEIVAHQAFTRRPEWFTGGTDQAAQLLAELTRPGPDGDLAPILLYQVGSVRYAYFRPESWARFQGTPRAKRGSRHPLPNPTHCEHVRALARTRAQMRADASSSESEGQACARPTPYALRPRSTPSRDAGAPEQAPAPAREGSSTRMARIAKWHAEAMRATRGSKAIVEDLAGAAVCEPLMAQLSDADCEAVVRAYVADPDAYLVKHGHPLRLLDAGRVNRYLTPEPTTPRDTRKPVSMEGY